MPAEIQGQVLSMRNAQWQQQIQLDAALCWRKGRRRHTGHFQSKTRPCQSRFDLSGADRSGPFNILDDTTRRAVAKAAHCKRQLSSLQSLPNPSHLGLLLGLARPILRCGWIGGGLGLNDSNSGKQGQREKAPRHSPSIRLPRASAPSKLQFCQGQSATLSAVCLSHLEASCRIF